jgi:Cu(I)/Ag(I) efflux system membrane fusion protein
MKKMKKTILLVAAIVCMTAFSACSNANKNKNASNTTEAIVSTHATIKVQGACEMCKERIETAAQSVEGVISASYNLEEKQLHLDYDAEKTTPEAVSKAVAQAGHDTELDRASDDVYSALPPCCQYRG